MRRAFISQQSDSTAAPIMNKRKLPFGQDHYDSDASDAVSQHGSVDDEDDDDMDDLIDPALATFYPEDELENLANEIEEARQEYQNDDDGNDFDALGTGLDDYDILQPDRPQPKVRFEDANDDASDSAADVKETFSGSDNELIFDEDDDQNSDPEVVLDQYTSSEEDYARRVSKVNKENRALRKAKTRSAMREEGVTEGLRRPSRGKSKKAPGKRSKKYKTPEQKAEFRRLNGLVTAAWLKEDYDEALRHALDAIQVDPTQFSLHATVSEILMKKGRDKDAVDALFAGVQSNNEVNNWWYVADHVQRSSKNTVLERKRLIFCYSTILRLEKDENQLTQARIERMKAYHNHRSFRRARGDCLLLLEKDPYNAFFLRTLAQVSTSLNQPEPAVKEMKVFVDYSMEVDYDEQETDLSWDMASMYIELLAQANQLEEAIHMLKVISRWILGRQHETYWDNLEDDREWDIEDDRRNEIKNFVANEYQEEQYGAGLPIEFRVRLATLRIQTDSDDIDEAMRHLNLLYPEEQTDPASLEDFVDLFLEAGQNLRQCNHHVEALRFYEALRIVGETLDAEFFFELAICYQALGRPDDVRGAIEGIKNGDRSASRQIGLAKLYQSQGKIDKMWRVCGQIRRAGRSDLLKQAGLPTERPSELPLPAEKPFTVRSSGVEKERARKKSVLRVQEEEQERFRDQVIRTMWNDIDPAKTPLFEEDETKNQQWFSIAAEVWQEFRSCEDFFPRDRGRPFTGFGRYKFHDSYDPHVSARENRAIFGAPISFRLIHFDDWLEFILHYAIKCAAKYDQSTCWQIMRKVETANVIYQDPKRYYLCRLTALRCAIMTNNELEACRQTRWFSRHHSIAAEATMLMTTANKAMHLYPKEYQGSSEQKNALRQIKTMDWGVLTQQQQYATRDKMFAQRPQPSITWDHKIHDATWLVEYAHLMVMGFAPTSGLNYYFRAYALRPDDPMMNLSLGLTYIALALKRQSANRQFHIQQAWFFIRVYHEARLKSDKAILRQEAEFNVGMAYHTLGIFHQALSAYEKAISLSDEVCSQALEIGTPVAEIEDFSMDAALAIRSIQLVSGATEAAHKTTQQYLVL